MSEGAWKLCSSCKKEIGFGSLYYRCSVSTCQSKRTGMYFCSVPCFEAHLPMMRHRDAWAEQETAPSRAQAAAEAADTERKIKETAERKAKEAAERQDREEGATDGSGARRRILNAQTGELQENTADLPKDVLVVASKLKNYIKARAGMNTSDGVLPVLSDHLRRLSILALRHAAQEGRKTVLDRDFQAVLSKLDL